MGSPTRYAVGWAHCSDLLSSCLGLATVGAGRAGSPALLRMTRPRRRSSQLIPSCIAGEYLQRRATGEPDAESEESQPWALRLGTYLSEKKPGPWSLVANDRPQDPLVSACSLVSSPSGHIVSLFTR